jgi:hypothetical protein
VRLWRVMATGLALRPASGGQKPVGRRDSPGPQSPAAKPLCMVSERGRAILAIEPLKQPEPARH